MCGQGAGVLHAKPQPPQRPGVGQRHDADRHRTPAANGCGFGHDGKPDAAFHKPADRIEAGKADAQPKLPAGARRMAVDVVLKRGARRQADEVVGQRVGKGDATAAGERMLRRRHENEAVFGKGEGLELRGRVDGVGYDADIGRATGDGAHDLGARPLLDGKIDVGMRCQERTEQRWQEFLERGRVGQQSHPAAQALRESAQLAAHQLQLLRHKAGVMDHGTAGGRRADATPPALEQWGAERQLHVADALARGGKREAAARPTVGNACRFGDVQDQTEVGQIEPHRRQVRQYRAFGQTEGSFRIFRIVRLAEGGKGASHDR